MEVYMRSLIKSRLFSVNTASGALTVVGTTFPSLTGTSFGFDFNPGG
jgi:hypothetical protein